MHRLFIILLTVAIPTAVYCAGGQQDPSEVALPEDGITNRERYRVIADFDGDGHEDLALSQSLSLFGNGGGPMDIYLGDQRGGYTKIGSTTCFPRNMAIERHHPHNRLWVYWKMGGAEGYLGYHEIREQKMTEFRSIEVFPGDGGTGIGNAIVDAVLDHSDVAIVVEVSSTTGNVVTWRHAH
ncbi:MAG: hypothetical protein ABFR33_05185 [Verrucomicrobiota bacterium]